MNFEDRKKHWENIYKLKNLNELSWYQSSPTTSLQLLTQFDVSRTSRIIDIGGGDSLFVDHLLDLGYKNVTVLDISEMAIEKAKLRLGVRSQEVNWIVADAAKFDTTEKYDFWHDRAAFHFLTQEQEIDNYVNTAQRCISPTGLLVLGTFSEQGPEKCSGIAIKQYSEYSMNNRFNRFFKKIKCITVDHLTPFNTVQNFIFCSFRRLPAAT